MPDPRPSQPDRHPHPDTGLVEVVEFTDPASPWAWGSDPLLRWARRHHGPALRWRRAFGVAIDRFGDHHPGRDAVRDAEAFRRDWLAVAAHTGAPVAERLERMPRSTRPAAQAARAAERQVTPEHPDVADRTLRRLREALLVHGRPFDTRDRLVDALAGVPGLDLERLLSDLDTSSVVESVQADREESRRPHPAVVARQGRGPYPGAAEPDGPHLRYAFPTLLLHGPAGDAVVAGWNTPGAVNAALEGVGAPAVDVSATLDPDEALARYGTLTREDLRLSTGGREPRDAVRIDTATSPLWVHPDEIGPLGGVVGRRVAAPPVAAD
jgi:predicted DsbA family dithiol-disulfide isomerase